jgi:hypothetical protein
MNPEKVADGYAADLLMPNYIFKPIARQQKQLSWKTVDALADVFDTSLTATAIRLVEGDYFPALLVCHAKVGRRWFVRAPSVPSRWFPQDVLDANSFAFDVLFGDSKDDPMQRKIGAEAWFDRYDAERFEIQEQSCRVGEEILTLLVLTDQRMLADYLA